jgi:hypothetical protein
VTIAAVLASVRRLLSGGAWDPLARGAWCRRQQRLLRVPGQAVVWVPREAVAWAEWGAGRGYFDLQRMSGLPYLSALAAPAG